MVVALVTQYIVNTCQEDYGIVVLAEEGTPDSSNKTVHFCYICEWANASNTFKRQLAFSFPVVISA